MLHIALLFLGLELPVFTALALAVFQGRNMAGRWLFVFAGPVVSYAFVGCTVVVADVVGVWLCHALNHIAPGLASSLSLQWFADSPFPLIILHTHLGVVASVLVVLGWRRWPSVLQVLASPPAERASSH